MFTVYDSIVRVCLICPINLWKIKFAIVFTGNLRHTRTLTYALEIGTRVWGVPTSLEVINDADIRTQSELARCKCKRIWMIANEMNLRSTYLSRHRLESNVCRFWLCFHRRRGYPLIRRHHCHRLYTRKRPSIIQIRWKWSSFSMKPFYLLKIL